MFPLYGWRNGEASDWLRKKMAKFSKCLLSLLWASQHQEPGGSEANCPHLPLEVSPIWVQILALPFASFVFLAK